MEEARRLIEIEGVHAIVGPLSSTVTIAVAESVTGLAGIPTISPSATSPAVSLADDNGFLFRSTVSDAAQGPVLANLAVDEGFDNVGVIFRNDAYGQGLAEAFENSFTGTVTSTSYEADQVSYLAELQRVAGEGGARPGCDWLPDGGDHLHPGGVGERPLRTVSCSWTGPRVRT